MIPIHRYIALCWIPLLFAGCSPIDSLQPFDEAQVTQLYQAHYTKKCLKQMFVLSLPRHAWKKTSRLPPENHAPTILIPRGTQLTIAHERIETRVSLYLNDPTMRAAQFREQQIQKEKSACQDVSIRIQQSNATSTVYQLDATKCHCQAAHTIISKAINGIDAVYEVSYYADTTKIPAAQIKQLSQTILQTNLVLNHQPSCFSSSSNFNFLK